jgi:hypothetical protein
MTEKDLLTGKKKLLAIAIDSIGNAAKKISSTFISAEPFSPDKAKGFWLSGSITSAM